MQLQLYKHLFNKSSALCSEVTSKVEHLTFEGHEYDIEAKPTALLHIYFSYCVSLLHLKCIGNTLIYLNVLKSTLAIILKYLLSRWKLDSTGVSKNFTFSIWLRKSLAFILKHYFQEENLAPFELGRV